MTDLLFQSEMKAAGLISKPEEKGWKMDFDYGKWTTTSITDSEGTQTTDSSNFQRPRIIVSTIRKWLLKD